MAGRSSYEPPLDYESDPEVDYGDDNPAYYDDNDENHYPARPGHRGSKPKPPPVLPKPTRSRSPRRKETTGDQQGRRSSPIRERSRNQHDVSRRNRGNSAQYSIQGQNEHFEGERSVSPRDVDIDVEESQPWRSRRNHLGNEAYDHQKQKYQGSLWQQAHVIEDQEDEFEDQRRHSNRYHAKEAKQQFGGRSAENANPGRPKQENRKKSSKNDKKQGQAKDKKSKKDRSHERQRERQITSAPYYNEQYQPDEEIDAPPMFTERPRQRKPSLDRPSSSTSFQMNPLHDNANSFYSGYDYQYPDPPYQPDMSRGPCRDDQPNQHYNHYNPPPNFNQRSTSPYKHDDMYYYPQQQQDVANVHVPPPQMHYHHNPHGYYGQDASWQQPAQPNRLPQHQVIMTQPQKGTGPNVIIANMPQTGTGPTVYHIQPDGTLVVATQQEEKKKERTKANKKWDIFLRLLNVALILHDTINDWLVANDMSAENEYNYQKFYGSDDPEDFWCDKDTLVGFMYLFTAIGTLYSTFQIFNMVIQGIKDFRDRPLKLPIPRWYPTLKKTLHHESDVGTHLSYL